MSSSGLRLTKSQLNIYHLISKRGSNISLSYIGFGTGPSNMKFILLKVLCKVCMDLLRCKWVWMVKLGDKNIDD